MYMYIYIHVAILAQAIFAQACFCPPCFVSSSLGIMEAVAMVGACTGAALVETAACGAARGGGSRQVVAAAAAAAIRVLIGARRGDEVALGQTHEAKMAVGTEFAKEADTGFRLSSPVCRSCWLGAPLRARSAASAMRRCTLQPTEAGWTSMCHRCTRTSSMFRRSSPRSMLCRRWLCRGGQV